MALLDYIQFFSTFAILVSFRPKFKLCFA